jgi:hypothetical protein
MHGGENYAPPHALEAAREWNLARRDEAERSGRIVDAWRYSDNAEHLRRLLASGVAA